MDQVLPAEAARPPSDPPFAGFLAWFIFIGPGVAEVTHFIFPLLQPAIQPELPGTISQAVSNGRFVADMGNYYIGTTGRYYFPGMYTAVLPMIPGIWAIVRMVRSPAVGVLPVTAIRVGAP